MLTDEISLNFQMFFGKSEAVVRRCSVREVFLEISQNSQENTCVRVSFLIKLQSLWHRCFPVNFAKFLRTPFFTEYLRWLPLGNSLPFTILQSEICFWENCLQNFLVDGEKLIWQSWEEALPSPEFKTNLFQTAFRSRRN